MVMKESSIILGFSWQWKVNHLLRRPEYSRRN